MEVSRGGYWPGNVRDGIDQWIVARSGKYLEVLTGNIKCKVMEGVEEVKTDM
jgi:hypothetical protein